MVITYVYRFWKKSDEDLVASLYTLSRTPSTRRVSSSFSDGRRGSYVSTTDAGLSTITGSYVLTEVSLDWSDEYVDDRSIRLSSRSRPSSKIHC